MQAEPRSPPIAPLGLHESPEAGPWSRSMESTRELVVELSCHSKTSPEKASQAHPWPQAGQQAPQG